MFIGSVVAVLKDQLELAGAEQSKIYRLSRLVEMNSGIHIPQNKPVVGEFVFTQWCPCRWDSRTISTARTHA